MAPKVATLFYLNKTFFLTETRQLISGDRDASRQGRAEVLRQREEVLLSAAVHLPLRRRLATEKGGDAEERRV